MPKFVRRLCDVYGRMDPKMGEDSPPRPCLPVPFEDAEFVVDLGESVGGDPEYRRVLVLSVDGEWTDEDVLGADLLAFGIDVARGGVA